VSVSKASEAIASEVARLLREKRMAKRLSLNGLSAKSGVSRQMLSYIEKEERNPSLDTLLRLSLALGVNLDDVIRHARKAALGQKAK
jgi:transcriptional regulator with XRE-family HTH domain